MDARRVGLGEHRPEVGDPHGLAAGEGRVLVGHDPHRPRALGVVLLERGRGLLLVAGAERARPAGFGLDRAAGGSRSRPGRSARVGRDGHPSSGQRVEAQLAHGVGDYRCRSACRYTLTWVWLSVVERSPRPSRRSARRAPARPTRPSRRGRPGSVKRRCHGRSRTGCAVAQLDVVAGDGAGLRVGAADPEHDDVGVEADDVDVARRARPAPSPGTNASTTTTPSGREQRGGLAQRPPLQRRAREVEQGVERDEHARRRRPDGTAAPPCRPPTTGDARVRRPGSGRASPSTHRGRRRRRPARAQRPGQAPGAAAQLDHETRRPAAAMNAAVVVGRGDVGVPVVVDVGEAVAVASSVGSRPRRHVDRSMHRRRDRARSVAWPAMIRLPPGELPGSRCAHDGPMGRPGRRRTTADRQSIWRVGPRNRTRPAVCRPCARRVGPTAAPAAAAAVPADDGPRSARRRVRHRQAPTPRRLRARGGRSSSRSRCCLAVLLRDVARWRPPRRPRRPRGIVVRRRSGVRRARDAGGVARDRGDVAGAARRRPRPHGRRLVRRRRPSRPGASSSTRCGAARRCWSAWSLVHLLELVGLVGLVVGAVRRDGVPPAGEPGDRRRGRRPVPGRSADRSRLTSTRFGSPRSPSRRWSASSGRWSASGSRSSPRSPASSCPTTGCGSPGRRVRPWPSSSWCPFTAGVAVLYHLDLRIRSEGLDIERRTRALLELTPKTPAGRPARSSPAPSTRHRRRARSSERSSWVFDRLGDADRHADRRRRRQRDRLGDRAGPRRRSGLAAGEGAACPGVWPAASESGDGPAYGTESHRSAAVWLAEADRLAAAGDSRGAIRCRYQALVARVITWSVVDDVPGRTAGEYRDLLSDRLPAARRRASIDLTDRFEAVWYGGRDAGIDRYAAVRRAVRTRRGGRASARWSAHEPARGPRRDAAAAGGGPGCVLRPRPAGPRGRRSIRCRRRPTAPRRSSSWSAASVETIDVVDGTPGRRRRRRAAARGSSAIATRPTTSIVGPYGAARWSSPIRARCSRPPVGGGLVDEITGSCDVPGLTDVATLDVGVVAHAIVVPPGASGCFGADDRRGIRRRRDRSARAGSSARRAGPVHQRPARRGRQRRAGRAGLLVGRRRGAPHSCDRRSPAAEIGVWST